MRHKIFLLCFVMNLHFLYSFSQANKYVYYFDADLNTTDKSKSISTGVASLENGLIKLQVSSNLTQQPVLIAFFTDSSLAVKQGLFQSFFKNGRMKSQGNYENNIENGSCEEWDGTGHLIDSTIYDHGKVIDSTRFYYDKNGTLRAHKFVDIKNDKEHIISYNDSGKMISEISFVGQKGILTSYESDTIKTDSLFTREEIQASYPGGSAAWNQYIASRIGRNYDELIKDGQTGTCWVDFMIDTDGKIKNVKATTLQGSALAKIAVNIISNSPKWKPAMEYGRPVKAYRLQPVGFTQ